MVAPVPLTAILICGANGAGKTTFARQLLPLRYRGIDFLNVDEIQRSTSPPLSQVAAARVFLKRLVEMERNRQSFALETTLSSRTYAPRIERWQKAGYHVVLHFRGAVSRLRHPARRSQSRSWWPRHSRRRRAPSLPAWSPPVFRAIPVSRL